MRQPEEKRASESRSERSRAETRGQPPAMRNATRAGEQCVEETTGEEGHLGLSQIRLRLSCCTGCTQSTLPQPVASLLCNAPLSIGAVFARWLRVLWRIPLIVPSSLHRSHDASLAALQCASADGGLARAAAVRARWRVCANSATTCVGADCRVHGRAAAGGAGHAAGIAGGI